MDVKKEILQAIADEKAQVTEALTDLSKQIQDLKDQITTGTPVSQADLDEIKVAIQDIYTLAPTPIPPTPAA